MHGPRPQRVLGYARVSGAEQARHGTSLEEQPREIARWCEAQGYPAPVMFVEQESGAAGPEIRRELGRLLAEARRGDMVVVVALDRWSRDLPEAVRSVRALLARGVRFYAIREGLDPSTESGQMQLGYLAVGADHERRRTRERTNIGRLAVLRQGLWPYGRIPLGYKRVEKRRLEIDDGAAEVVRWIYARCIAGVGTTTIAKEGRQRWPDWYWSQQRVTETLRSRLYLGEIKVTNEEEWVRGQHPSIIEESTWGRAQEALRSRRGTGPQPRGAARSSALLLTGIANCGACGKRIAVSPGRQRNDGSWRSYYNCGRNRKKCGSCAAAGYTPADDVDPLVERLVLERLVELRAHLRAPAAPPPAVVDVDRRRAALQRKRDRVTELLVERKITDADAARQFAKFYREGDALAQAAAEVARQARAADPKVRAEVLRSVDGVQRAWARMEVPARREAIKLLARRVVLLPGQPPLLEWRSVEELGEDVGK